ncbi:hypothetical protein M409DRAFT_19385 [Zasmidium cellare ATCC 36951]|uniref:Uncharacterized protein n=1 Tax=Zasmidium cellare ATCC 36951 TaxID=1080233 RepID=A0A6A6CYW6_ZASCE|nr:uncharacterized protein M409DRAFT_19385 [Zasmidium cellare ATCC 36951]KAF2170566.1 hypothetical protein M409DRAFT_19385 [Zasmidium cellare ATCC 36951]
MSGRNLKMTPEDYKRLHEKLSRYGERFDSNVDTHLPADLVRTKRGAIAKRQPHFPARNAAYYKAQCSFRGLKTSGKIDELQQLLKTRDIAQDARIKNELEGIQKQVDAYQEEERRREAERWWLDPVRTLDAKTSRDAFRAVEESLAREDVLKTSCHVFARCSDDLEDAARKLNLAYEFIDLAPGSFSMNARQIIGQEAAVKAAAKRIREEAEQQRRDAEARCQAEVARRRAAARARQEQMLAEAKQAPDWDISGSWTVECNPLAEYSEGPDRRATLSMEIWRDGFSLEDVRQDEPDSDDEDNEDEEEDEEDDHRRGPISLETPHPHDASIPRFHASFDFGVVEGTMRIYPPSSNRPARGSFKIKQNPSFQYVYRCRETGEGEIPIETDGYQPETITFADHGTRFRGMFRCPLISGLVEIKGRKRSHGRGERKNSKEAWTELSESAWDRGHSKRWGGW